MTIGHMVAAVALLGTLLINQIEINLLKRRIAALERRTIPLSKLCNGTEDDFYEAFFRLVQEECDKK